MPEIACVILEPVMGSAGLWAAPAGLPRPGSGRGACRWRLLIFDEVITLRLSTGGAQARYGVTPDLTAMGKIVGGGFPVGAVGGRADLMEVLDPRNPRLFHSGTFNGNPVTCAAGIVSVEHLTSDRIGVMDEQAARIGAGLRRCRGASGPALQLQPQRFDAAMLPRRHAARGDARAVPTARSMSQFHLASLNHGLFFAGRGMMALSTVISDELVDEVIERCAAALADVAAKV